MSDAITSQPLASTIGNIPPAALNITANGVETLREVHGEQETMGVPTNYEEVAIDDGEEKKKKTKHHCSCWYCDDGDPFDFYFLCDCFSSMCQGIAHCLSQCCSSCCECLGNCCESFGECCDCAECCGAGDDSCDCGDCADCCTSCLTGCDCSD